MIAATQPTSSGAKSSTIKVAAWKRTEVEELKVLMKQYPVIAIADLKCFPSNLFQEVRKKLHGKAVVKVTRMRLIRRAIEESTNVKNVIKLNDHVAESCAIIFSKMDSFELSNFLRKNKGSMPAVVGQIATDDVIIPAMDTGMPPGPALSDLKSAGLKTNIMAGTIHISEEKVVTAKGQVFTAGVVGTLTKLNIKPNKVGLNLVASFEAGEVFTKDVLDVDPEQVEEDITKAAWNSFALALGIAYVSKLTAEPLIAKAHREALAVALEAKIIDSEEKTDKAD